MSKQRKDFVLNKIFSKIPLQIMDNDEWFLNFHLYEIYRKIDFSSFYCDLFG